MYLIVVHYLILCLVYKVAIAMPMIGENVTRTEEGKYSAVVSIGRKNFLAEDELEKDHVCTGVLITRINVLTVFHCKEQFRGYVTVVRVGSQDIRNTQPFYVQWWMSYNGWMRSKSKVPKIPEIDIAVIKLTEMVPEDIVFPSRARTDAHQFLGKVSVAVGFGSIANQTHSRYLHQVHMKLMQTRHCEQTIELLQGSAFKVYDTLLCASAHPFALLTEGNDGAPLYYKNKLIGLHKGICPSNLNDPNDPRKINVFVSTNYFNRFINDVVENY